MQKKQIAQIRAQCKRLGITWDQVAKEAGVTRGMVSSVFCLRFKSQPVLQAALRVISQRIEEAKKISREVAATPAA